MITSTIGWLVTKDAQCPFHSEEPNNHVFQQNRPGKWDRRTLAIDGQILQIRQRWAGVNGVVIVRIEFIGPTAYDAIIRFELE